MAAIETVGDEELYARLRREIMYLGKTRREAVILRYWDGLSGDEIASRLGIPAATVRWHLHKAKTELRERIEMKEQESMYRPVKLSIGQYGWGDNPVLAQLESDVLMQSVCYACFDRALTIEELSRTLGVAAAYLEDKLDKLVGMEYMRRGAKGKYQTAFFIRDARYQLEHSKYQFKHSLPLAKAYYEVVAGALPDIQRIGFAGSDIGDNMLLWDVLLYFMMREMNARNEDMIARLNLQHGAPMRPDGSRHWVRAATAWEEVEQAAEREGAAFLDFCRNAANFSLRSAALDTRAVCAVKLDAPFVSGFAWTWNPLTTVEIRTIQYARELIQTGKTPSELDKSAIASIIEKGYAARENGQLRLLAPYLTATEAGKLNGILEARASRLLDREANIQPFLGYAEHMKALIPACVCENERNHYLTSFDPYNAILWHLTREGLLTAPNEDERKYVCTMLWER